MSEQWFQKALFGSKKKHHYSPESAAGSCPITVSLLLSIDSRHISAAMTMQRKHMVLNNRNTDHMQ
eukprot:7610365-Ditylum_brightwellii.AAC.1